MRQGALRAYTATMMQGVLALGLASSATPLRAASCWSTDQANAFKIRQLQIKLMVSALQCSMRGDTAMRSAYDSFVTSQRPELLANSRTLKNRFAADYGVKGVVEFDSFITQFANATAADPQAAGDCAARAGTAEAAAAATHDELVALASQMIPEPDPRVACAPGSRLSGLTIE